MKVKIVTVNNDPTFLLFRARILDAITSWRKKGTKPALPDKFDDAIKLFFLRWPAGTTSKHDRLVGFIYCDRIYYEKQAEKLLITVSLYIDIYIFSAFWLLWYIVAGQKMIDIEDIQATSIAEQVLGSITTVRDLMPKYNPTLPQNTALNLIIECDSNYRIYFANLQEVYEAIDELYEEFKIDLMDKMMNKRKIYINTLLLHSLMKNLDSIISTIKDEIASLPEEIMEALKFLPE